ncbi:hypothetical protein KORDIASMS9_00192 [Kordia sp. SMS9]|uniref:hypothetical protein n=1 Tax=Kordia sp. SMS9 TaxID=2282170 RepID=UPI000E0DF7FA|nr:hypothetical protein [Kordia sp. SMS9]AXG68008.1 hypothetical protein KORDIASMS9_00192 [Kordia sp. SMS9]
MIVKIDTVANFIVGLMIPKFIFLLLKWTSEFGGAAAITSRLKEISFDIGMEEGIGVFVLLGILFYKLSEYAFYRHYASKIEREQLQQKLLYEEVLQRIDSYTISKSLKTRLKSEYIIRNY